MKKTSARKKYSLGNAIISFCIIVFTIICVLPMVLTVMVSFTAETAIMRYGYSFFPKKFSLYAYQLIFSSHSTVVHGYVISIIVTLIGTLSALIITGLAGYTLANKNVKYRGALGFVFFVPMVFSAGIVPWYLLCLSTGLINNIWALIVPSLLFNPFNLFLVRNYMSGLPDSLRESATIDGANDIVIAIRIYLPLSVPVLATVGLFYGLAYWTDWWNAIMLVDKPTLWPIQYLLLQLQSQIAMIQQLQMSTGTSGIPPAESLKMATALITIGPIVLLYPFLQKYYVEGLVVGSVKG